MKYFIPRYRNWYMQVLGYPSRYRYGLTCLILMGIIFFWYLMLYRPLEYSISSYYRTNNTLRLQLKEQEEAQRQCLVISTSIKKLERELGAYQSCQLCTNDLITLSVKQASLHKMVIASCNAEQMVDHGWYQMYPIIVEIGGQLAGISQWITAIAAKNRLITVPSMTVSMVDQNMVRCHASISSINIRDTH